MELAAMAAKPTSAWDEPGTLGFLVVFGMAIILFFVFRSLARHLRKINEAARLEVAQAELLQAGSVQPGAVQPGSVLPGSVLPGPVSSAPGSDSR
jgi:hypothetical protein